MTAEEAIKILNTVLFFGKCDCQKEEIEECLKMAIEALKKTSWVPITYRDMTEEEKNEITVNTVDTVEGIQILNCSLPDDGEEVLITTYCGNVFTDVFHNKNGDCYFEDYYIEDARAWMPLPKPYEKEAEA